jgi:hypothetical protein
LRDVISKYPDIANEVRKELEIAFEIMSGKVTKIVEDVIEHDDDEN